MKRDEFAELRSRMVELAEGRTPLRLMEVCGTHTVSFFRSGVKSLLPEGVELVSGPGCPVCVTSQGYLDAACQAAARPDTVICTYGDMVRVPGTTGSLESLRGQGARIRVVFSARDALNHAAENPQDQVVFLAVGFETTSPGTAATLLEARARGVKNFFVLPAHKRIMPAMIALLSAKKSSIDAFVLPGHVSIILGLAPYEPIARDFGKACVVTGFEPEQLAHGVLRLLELLAEGRAAIENVYGVAVRPEGNPVARALVEQVFEPCDAEWRALGSIPDSGLALRPAFAAFDAFAALDLTEGPNVEPDGCRCGEVIQGLISPVDCALFGRGCSPRLPVGPCMVSSEGTCAAWYKYGKQRRP